MSEQPTSRTARRSIHDLPIAARIALAVLVASLAGVASSGFAVLQLGATADRGHTLYTANLVGGLAELADISDRVQNARLALFQLAVADNQQGIDTQRAAIKTADAGVAEHLGRYRTTGADKATITQFEQTWAAYRAARDQNVISLAENLDPASITAFEDSRKKNLSALVTQLYKELDTMQAAEMKAAAAADGASQRAYRQATLLVLGIQFAGLIGSIAIAVLVARRMNGTIRRVSVMAAALRAGRLGERSGVRGADELARMAADLDDAATTLGRTVQQVAATADSVASSAQELSATTSQIAGEAERSSQQAGYVAAGSSEIEANIQNLASATEEMTASIREIATNASTAARTAEEAGGEVEGIQTTISKLGESSARISTVVNLISSIAEQTNLLALNATIEAARAGEAGKGFAVVANEVKELASQTALATTEISEQVETIQQDVDASVQAISRIVSTVADINTMQTAIAGAVEQQTTTTMDISRSVQEAAQGSSQISETIGQVADAATSTSAGVGQAQAATSALAQLAGDLRRLTGTFSC